MANWLTLTMTLDLTSLMATCSVLFGLTMIFTVLRFRLGEKAPRQSEEQLTPIQDQDTAIVDKDIEDDRQRVVEEFLASEERYLNRLLMTQNKFLLPLTLMQVSARYVILKRLFLLLV